MCGVIALFCFAPAQRIYSKAYFVDFASGADTNAGTSTSSAWQHCPGDSNASNVSLSTTLVPGDIVNLKGGVKYSGKISVSGSGSAGNVITFDGNSTGTWGTGKAVIDLALVYYRAFDVTASYISIKNFEMINAKNHAGNIEGYVHDSGGNNLTISDCIFHDVEGWNVVGAQGSDSSVWAEQIGIYISQADTIRISGCEFFAIGTDGINLFRATNVDIGGCNFGGINRGSSTGYFSVAIRMQYNTYSVFVHDCIFHDAWQYEGDDPIQRDHAGDWSHIYGGTEYPHDIVFDRCLFYNNKAFAYCHGTSDIYVESGAYNVTIRNSIFANPHASNGSVMAYQAGPIFVYSNTFISYNTINDGVLCLKMGMGTTNDSVVENNIFINLTTQSEACIEVYDAGFSGTIDYNAYYRPADPTQICRRSSTWYSLARWQTLGYDAHSYYGNPNLSNIATQATSGLGTFSLTSASIDEIDHGKTISGFNSDYANNLRPMGAKWDIGAYEFSGRGSTILMPQHLRLKQ
jgi:hypothetical protein